MIHDIQNIERWIRLMQQSHEAHYYASRATQLGHPEQFYSMDGILEFFTYFKGALNSYGKCFISGKMSLDKNSVFVGKHEFLDQHNRLIDLRHKYVAHNDENEIEDTEITTEETDSELVIELNYKFAFAFDRLYELRDLIDHLQNHIADRQAKHIAGMALKIGKPIRIKEGHQQEELPLPQS